MSILAPISLRSSTARNRVMFGPHPTNLGDGRRFAADHVAYYERRATGGAGIIVTEEASVHPSDWPYERSPLASVCGVGWAAIATACRSHDALVVAALGHSGGQGSSAYHQRELWAPSTVPEVNSREVPKSMEQDDIEAVVDGFADGARIAVDAGCDGIEINAGQHSLVRQFLSGLTNHRNDEWGADRIKFARTVIEHCRARIGSDAILGLRLSCDELAPWAGITPEMALPIARELAPLVDYIVVVRGSIYSVEKTRPDYHEPELFNVDLCRDVKHAVAVPIVLQGSVVDAGRADAAVADGVADIVEMTRAQIADPDLVAKFAAGNADQVRPCIRCNQTCMVRDPRNPIVTCVGEPSAGHEAHDPDWYGPTTTTARNVRVIGGGPAGLEVARVAAIRGHRVTVLERSNQLGGLAAVAGPGGALVEWLEREVRRLGVTIHTAADAADAADVVSVKEMTKDSVVIQCTGSRAGERSYTAEPGATIIDIADLRRGNTLADISADARVVIHDPIGGPIAVALAEELGQRAVLVTPDQIAGNELARTGDLAPANTRLAQRGVRIERRSILRTVGIDHVEIEDRFTGQVRRIDDVTVVVDCGFRLPDADLPGATMRAGDCVAPRTLYEAILEGRRAAASLG